MARIKNEEKGQFRAGKEQAETARKGGIASGEARRKKKELRELMEMLLENKIKTKGGEEITTAEAICVKQIEKALKGDAKAFEIVRDTAGQKPKDNVDMSLDTSPIVINNNVTE